MCSDHFQSQQPYKISILTCLDLAPCELLSQEASERTPHWMKGKSVLVSRRHDPRTMGLGPAEPRLNAVSMAPRLCHMSAGGPRRFTIGDSEFARATSPYELEPLGAVNPGSILWLGDVQRCVIEMGEGQVNLVGRFSTTWGVIEMETNKKGRVNSKPTISRI